MLALNIYAEQKQHLVTSSCISIETSEWIGSYVPEYCMYSMLVYILPLPIKLWWVIPKRLLQLISWTILRNDSTIHYNIMSHP